MINLLNSLTFSGGLYAVLNLIVYFNKIKPFSKKFTSVLILIFPAIYYFISTNFSIESDYQNKIISGNNLFFSFAIYGIVVSCLNRVNIYFDKIKSTNDKFFAAKPNIINLCANEYRSIIVVFIHIVFIIISFFIAKLNTGLLMSMSYLCAIIFSMVFHFRKQFVGVSEIDEDTNDLFLVFEAISYIPLAFAFLTIIIIDFLSVFLIIYPSAGLLAIIVLFMDMVIFFLISISENKAKNKEPKPYLGKLIIVTILLYPIMGMFSLITISKIDGVINKYKMIAYIENKYSIKVEVLSEKIGEFNDNNFLDIPYERVYPDYLELRTENESEIKFNISYEKGNIEENYLDEKSKKYKRFGMFQKANVFVDRFPIDKILKIP